MADTQYLKENLTGFVPTEKAADIIADTVRGSSILRLAKVEQMESDKKEYAVMTDGPGAYWVGETERIQTATASWIFPQIEAKKIAVIIPTTKEKMNDTTISVFETLKPYIAEAFHQTIDKACLFGDGSPFATNIYDAALGAGNIQMRAAGENLDITVSEAMGLVEDKGYDVDGFAAHYGVRREIRNLRDANGNQLYVPGIDGSKFYELPIEFVRNGAWDRDRADFLGGVWRYAIVGIRQGIEYEVLKEATLQNVTMPDGKPLSLAEQDMIAIKATMRLGFLVIKPEAFCAVAPAGAALGKLTVTSAAGTAAGDTKITIAEPLGAGNSYKYKVGASAAPVKYDQKCTTGWTAWDGAADITAASGKTITIAEVTADSEARKAGHAVATAKA